MEERGAQFHEFGYLRGMPNLGPFEIAIIALVVVLMFGTRRLPELGAGLGKAISNFRSSFREGSAADKSGNDEPKDPPKQV
jgi:sec-independent protein translocase protein TatA